MRKKGSIFFIGTTIIFILLCIGCTRKQNKILDPDDPVTLSIWHYYNGVQQTMFDEMVSEFNNTIGLEEGVIVEAISKNTIQELNNAINASLEEAVGAEELPNLFTAYSETAFIADKAGKLADISQYFSKEELEQYIDVYIEEGRLLSEDGLKIFPVAKCTEVMMVNKTDWDRFAEACHVDVEQMRTWEGLSKVAEQYYEYTDSLTPSVEGDGKAFFGKDSLANYMQVGAKQLGHPFVSLEEDGTVSLQCDKETVRRLWDCFYVPYVKGYYTANSRFRSDDAKTGDIIALICSTTGAVYFPTMVTPDDETSYEIESMVLSVPNFEGTEGCIIQQGAGICMTKAEKRQEYASALFLRWFTENERNIQYAIHSGYLPVKKDANDEQKILDATKDSKISQTVREMFRVANEEIHTYELYLSPPFENSEKLREFLEGYLSETIVADRTSVLQRINGGEEKDVVLSQYTDDAAFEIWYEGFEKGFDLAAGR